ncbi:hypothetical protein [Vogesella sp. EB]|uniref:hypothetical protein n=1 Tax=Vogesella sp. EB TaxID=1526735 RepID=UPI00069DA6BC|nr:hypothetical protein [Vogesella sp. EB]
MTKLNAPAVPGWPDVTRFEVLERLLGGDGGPLNRAPLELLERSEFLKKKIDDVVSGALTIEFANRLKTGRSIAMTGDGSWVVTFDGGGNVSAAMTLANTGVAAGTYPVVTIDSKGRVTAARALQSADLPANAALSGTPTAPTADPGTNTTQLANTAFVQAALAAFVASAPAALDTLTELAAALGNDANFATTITNALALKAPLASPALTGLPTAPTQPQGDNSTKLATTEFVQLAAQSVPVRQTVLCGVTDVNGRANFISAGAGLAVNLSATAAALTLAFSAGFGQGGSVDYIERITADAAGYWSNLPANSLNFLAIARNGAGNLSASATLAPVQYGYTYNQAAQALLHFDGAAGSASILDDFGNTWVAHGGAKLQSSWSKFGGTALGGSGVNNALNGAGDFIKSTNFTGLGGGSWAIRGWFNPSALPGNGISFCLAGMFNASSLGVQLYIGNMGGSIKFGYALSSNGTSNDITNATFGSTTPIVGTAYFVELTYDAVAGYYRLYVNGAQEASTASALRICPVTMATVGAGNTAIFFPGYIDEFEFLPYCDHPGGTAYAVPTAAKSIAAPGYASDWFDLATWTMKSPAAASPGDGSSPAFTVSNKLYVGEVITGAAGVSSVVSYAYQGKYKSADTAVPASGVRTAFSSNIGVPADLRKGKFHVRNYIAEYGFTPGMVTVPQLGVNANYIQGNQFTLEDRNSMSVTTGASGGLYSINRTTGAAASLTPGNWRIFVTDERAF